MVGQGLLEGREADNASTQQVKTNAASAVPSTCSVGLFCSKKYGTSGTQSVTALKLHPEASLWPNPAPTSTACLLLPCPPVPCPGARTVPAGEV